MNWKNRLTNYNFWISIFSATLLILQALKIEFDIAYINEIFTAVLGLLVVVGIISDPTRVSVKSTTENVKEQTQKETKDELKKEQEDLPVEKENEVNNVAFQDDIQNVLKEISLKIEEKIENFNQKIKEIENFYKKTEKTIDVNQNLETKENQLKEENLNINQPAVAEIDFY